MRASSSSKRSGVTSSVNKGATSGVVTPAASNLGLIGITSYNPVGQATASTVTTTYADVDATNLFVTFTTPPSGKVMVRATIRVSMGSNTTMGMNFREGSADLAGTNSDVMYFSSTGGGTRVVHAALVTGLAAGSAHIYKVGFAQLFGSGTAQILYGAAYGQALLEVWAVNL